MSTLVFPLTTLQQNNTQVRGLTWPIKRTPEFSTQVQQASSGKEIRLSYWSTPLWHWELSLDYLYDNPNNLYGSNPDTDLVTIQGFYLQMQGRFGTFLFDDPQDDTVYGQPIASGDGTTTTFQLIRTRGGFTEPIQAPFTDPPPIVYLNGVRKNYGTDYSVDAIGQIVFVVAPGGGTNITSDFSYYWLVRFDDDSAEYEEFMYQLWKLKSVKLVQVKL